MQYHCGCLCKNTQTMKLRPIDREKLLALIAGMKHGDVKAIAEIT